MPIFLQAVAAADRQFEIGDGNTEHLAHAVVLFLGVFVVELLVCGFGVLEEQRGAGVVGINVQHALVALSGLLILLAVFQQQAEIH